MGQAHRLACRQAFWNIGENRALISFRSHLNTGGSAGALRAIGYIVLALFAFSVSSARAEATFATERVAIELMAETNGVPADGGTIWLALREEIIPHWHTYWKNPGDSGEATEITWSLPTGFEAGEIHWPNPTRVPYGPLVNFGFEDEAILLIPLTVPSGLTPGDDVTLRANAYWLVCADVCVPEEGAVEISLPVVAGSPPLNLGAADIFARARQDFPQASPWEARFEEAQGTLDVALLGPDFTSPFAEGRIIGVSLFPDVPGLIDNAAPQNIRYGPEGMVLSVPSGPRFRRDAAPEILSGLIIFDEMVSGEHVSRAISFETAQGSIPAAAATRGFSTGTGSALSIGLGQALLFALIGGLILNLMPCVFPVVFLKALTFVSVAHERPWKVRFHGLAYTAGILVSFALIAAALLGLRAAGAQIGWGFQLQSPPVVIGLAFLLFAVGLNLSGVYSIGGSFMGLGGSFAERRGYAGSFFTGALAVVVASPCTAPFMATGLGFALTQPAWIGFATFLSLGFGLALPYLLLSFAPALLKLLPRPGAWMETFKHVLAIPMYGAAVWLLWVLAQQVSATYLILALVGLGVLTFALWAGQSIRTKTKFNLIQAGGLAALVLAVATTVFILPGGGALAGRGGETSTTEAIAYIPYSEARLDELRDEGETVFLNFTAAWCITCLMNERVIFSDAEFVQQFEDSGAVYMKGDWTNRDAEIAQALARFNRPGVPLYVVYRSGREPLVLPQVLSADVLLNAIEEH